MSVTTRGVLTPTPVLCPLPWGVSGPSIELPQKNRCEQLCSPPREEVTGKLPMSEGDKQPQTSCGGKDQARSRISYGEVMTSDRKQGSGRRAAIYDRKAGISDSHVGF